MFRETATTCLGFAIATAIGIGVVAFSAGNNSAFAKESIHVTVDRAKVMRIASPADTVIVGNPAVANAVMHNQNTLVIIGRSYGTTNIIVLDNESNPIADEVIVVRKADSSIVTVQRQTQRFSYSCAADCSPSLAPGDDEEFFKVSAEQVNKTNEDAENASK